MPQESVNGSGREGKEVEENGNKEEERKLYHIFFLPTFKLCQCYKDK